MPRVVVVVFEKIIRKQDMCRVVLLNRQRDMLCALQCRGGGGRGGQVYENLNSVGFKRLTLFER